MSRWTVTRRLALLLASLPALSGIALASPLDSNSLFGNESVPVEAWLIGELRTLFARAGESSPESSEIGCPAVPGYASPVFPWHRDLSASSADAPTGIPRPLRNTPSAPRAPPLFS